MRKCPFLSRRSFAGSSFDVVEEAARDLQRLFEIGESSVHGLGRPPLTGPALIHSPRLP